MSSKAKIWLYKYGNECKTITGGWTSDGYEKLTSDNVYNTSITKDADSMLNTSSGVKYGISYLGTNYAINFNSTDKIYFNIKSYQNNFSETASSINLNKSKGKVSAIHTKSVKYEGNKIGTYYLEAMDTPNDNNKYYLYNACFTHTDKQSNGDFTEMSVRIGEIYFETKENVISINSQNTSSINFSCNTFDNLISITKVEVYINDKLSKSYTSNFDNLTYDIDKNLCIIGANNIKIKVTYSQGDDIYETVEEALTHTNTVNNLSTTSSLKELIDRQELLTDVIEFQKNNLKSILESKNVEVSEEENKLSILINKVDELVGKKLWLYKEGDECVDITGGWIEGYKAGNNPTFTKNADSLQVKANGTSTNGSIGLFATSKSLDLTPYKAVKVIASIVTSSSNGRVRMEVTSTSTASTSNSLANYESNLGMSGSNLKFELNISSVSSGHVRVGVGGNTGNTMNIKIHEVWLEL